MAKQHPLCRTKPSFTSNLNTLAEAFTAPLTNDSDKVVALAIHTLRKDHSPPAFYNAPIHRQFYAYDDDYVQEEEDDDDDEEEDYYLSEEDGDFAYHQHGFDDDKEHSSSESHSPISPMTPSILYQNPLQSYHRMFSASREYDLCKLKENSDSVSNSVCSQNSYFEGDQDPELYRPTKNYPLARPPSPSVNPNDNEQHHQIEQELNCLPQFLFNDHHNNSNSNDFSAKMLVPPPASNAADLKAQNCFSHHFRHHRHHSTCGFSSDLKSNATTRIITTTNTNHTCLSISTLI